jgi:hypothetical protein
MFSDLWFILRYAFTIMVVVLLPPIETRLQNRAGVLAFNCRFINSYYRYYLGCYSVA